MVIFEAVIGSAVDLYCVIFRGVYPDSYKWDGQNIRNISQYNAMQLISTTKYSLQNCHKVESTTL